MKKTMGTLSIVFALALTLSACQQGTTDVENPLVETTPPADVTFEIGEDVMEEDVMEEDVMEEDVMEEDVMEEDVMEEDVMDNAMGLPDPEGMDDPMGLPVPEEMDDVDPVL